MRGRSQVRPLALAPPPDPCRKSRNFPARRLPPRRVDAPCQRLFDFGVSGSSRRFFGGRIFWRGERGLFEFPLAFPSGLSTRALVRATHYCLALGERFVPLESACR